MTCQVGAQDFSPTASRAAGGEESLIDHYSLSSQQSNSCRGKVTATTIGKLFTCICIYASCTGYKYKYKYVCLCLLLYNMGREEKFEQTHREESNTRERHMQ